MLDEDAQQLELSSGQLHRLAGDERLVGSEVDFELAESRGPAPGACAGAAQDGPNAGDDLGWGRGFDDVVVGAESESRILSPSPPRALRNRTGTSEAARISRQCRTLIGREASRLAGRSPGPVGERCGRLCWRRRPRGRGSRPLRGSRASARRSRARPRRRARGGRLPAGRRAREQCRPPAPPLRRFSRFLRTLFARARTLRPDHGRRHWPDRQEGDSDRADGNHDQATDAGWTIGAASGSACPPSCSAGLSLLVSACGGSPASRVAQLTSTTASLTTPGSSDATVTGKYAASLAYSRCMRSHGVTNFPDPKQVRWRNPDLGLRVGGSTRGRRCSCPPNSPAGSCRPAAASRPTPSRRRRSPGCSTSRGACGRTASRGSPIRRFLRHRAGPATAPSQATALHGWRSQTRSMCDPRRSSGQRPRASFECPVRHRSCPCHRSCRGRHYDLPPARCSRSALHTARDRSRAMSQRMLRRLAWSGERGSRSVSFIGGARVRTR